MKCFQQSSLIFIWADRRFSPAKWLSSFRHSLFNYWAAQAYPLRGAALSSDVAEEKCFWSTTPQIRVIRMTDFLTFCGHVFILGKWKIKISIFTFVRDSTLSYCWRSLLFYGSFFCIEKWQWHDSDKVTGLTKYVVDAVTVLPKNA